ncbi:hypothetical protein PMAYCL1PPCAC_05236, partial [Pristionchus mayeri]
KNARSVKVIWEYGNDELEGANNVLLEFPHVKIYRIRPGSGVICDDTLVHLAQNSEFAELTGVSAVTASGLADAFELVIAAKKKGVWCIVTKSVIAQLECSRFLISSTRVVHLESGAYLLYYPSDWNYGDNTYYVNMHTARTGQ